MAEHQYTGSCLCGEIQYQIDGEIGMIVQCHCQKCRKANGTAFATNAPIAKSAFKFTKSEKICNYRGQESNLRRIFTQ